MDEDITVIAGVHFAGLIEAAEGFGKAFLAHEREPQRMQSRARVGMEREDAASNVFRLILPAGTSQQISERRDQPCRRVEPQGGAIVALRLLGPPLRQMQLGEIGAGLRPVEIQLLRRDIGRHRLGERRPEWRRAEFHLQVRQEKARRDPDEPAWIADEVVRTRPWPAMYSRSIARFPMMPARLEI